jgi:hypothetical protein
MPLVDITLKPNFCLKLADMHSDVWSSAEITRMLVKYHFARALPGLFVENAEALGLDTTTPPEGIQVQNHDYGEFDVNVANVWVRIQLSESLPDEEERFRIRDVLYDILVNWFAVQGFYPEGFVMDLFWGPTNGKGVVDSVKIEW